jgi:hypothetical protein
MREVLDALIPAVRNDGDPPAKIERLIPIDTRTGQGTELARLLRPNGSELRLVARYYDGQARTGHRPLAYVTAYVIFTDPRSGLKFRTRGAMVERGELRTVAAALTAQADRLDDLEARGELPDFLQTGERPAACDDAAPDES